MAVRIIGLQQQFIPEASTEYSGTVNLVQNNNAMEIQELTGLFGYSEKSPEIRRILKQLDMPAKLPEMSICWRTYESTSLNLSLVFRARHNYVFDYGPFKKAFSKSSDESFLEQISFGGGKGSLKFPFSLPYSLAIGDSNETVIAKMKSRPSGKGTASYGNYFEFNKETVCVLTAFNNQEKLEWVRLKLLEKSFIRRREMKKTIAAQNKNIRSGNSTALGLLKNKTPMKKWTARMKKGDGLFTPSALSETSILLQRFIDQLQQASMQQKAALVMGAVKKVVQSLNQLNDKYNSLIETLEREELCDYIHGAVKLTGFIIPAGTDLTEEWREW